MNSILRKQQACFSLGSVASEDQRCFSVRQRCWQGPSVKPSVWALHLLNVRVSNQFKCTPLYPLGRLGCRSRVAGEQTGKRVQWPTSYRAVIPYFCWPQTLPSQRTSFILKNQHTEVALWEIFDKNDFWIYQCVCWPRLTFWCNPKSSFIQALFENDEVERLPYQHSINCSHAMAYRES